MVLGLKEIPNSNPILDIKDMELSAKLLGGGSEKEKINGKLPIIF